MPASGAALWIEAVLAVRNGQLVLDSEVLGDDDEIKLIAVISGG